MTGSSWLAFTPRDTVFIRDGRPFDAATGASARTVLPGPTTIAGAAGAAFGAEPLRVRGPVLARRGGDGRWEPHFPVPADLVVTDEEAKPYVFRLIPSETAGMTDLDHALAAEGGPLRWLVPPTGAEAVKPLPGWIPGRRLADYLAGTFPGNSGTALADTDLADADPARQPGPLLPEPRVGLARDEQRLARDGYLYQAIHLRLAENWAFLAECDFGSGWDRQPASPIRFGGRGRLADIEAGADATWPSAPAEPPGRRVLVYLATPAIWPGGWRIPLPDGARLVAAATGEPEPAVTVTVAPGEQWRSSRQSRVLSWAVPAGSIYLLEFDDPGQGAAWASEVHGTAYGRDDNERLRRLRTAGFGVVLTGAWK